MDAVLKQVSSFLIDAAIVGGAVVPWYYQVRELRETKEADGFSLQSSLALILGAIGTTLHWVCLPPKHKFSGALLLHAVTTVGAQLWLISVVLGLRHRRARVPTSTGAFLPRRRDELGRSLLSGHLALSDLWAWDDVLSYVVVTFSLFTSGFLLCSTLHATQLRGVLPDAVAIVGLTFSSAFALPQLLVNAQRRSTVGLSPIAVSSLAGADAMRAFVVIVRGDPLPYALCGAVQLLCDLGLAVQIVTLAARTPGHGAGQAAAAATGEAEGEEGGGDAFGRWASHAEEAAGGELQRATRVLAQEGLRSRL